MLGYIKQFDNHMTHFCTVFHSDYVRVLYCFRVIGLHSPVLLVILMREKASREFSRCRSRRKYTCT